MVFTRVIPERFENQSVCVEMNDAPDVNVWEKPFVGRDPARHATPETRHGHRKIVAWRPRPCQRDPIGPIRSTIYVVGIAGKIASALATIR